MPENPNKALVFYGVKYFPSKGGTSRVAENIIKNLLTTYKISIYCYKHPYAKNSIPGVRSIQFPELPFGGFGVFLYYFLTALHLLLFISRKSIIHAHKTDCAFFLPLLKLKFKKIIATSHEAPYHRDKWDRIGKAYFRIAEWIFMHSGATLTSISKPLADFYFQKYKKPVHFIPNGIDTIQHIDLISADNLLNKLKISETYFLYSARRIMSTKGLHTMLEALSILNSKTPVIIAGDESHAPKYLNRLKNKYNYLQLFFTGYLDLPVLLGLIRKSELFIFPSEIEGMSIMLLEVVSVGTPIICSDIPENTQVFSEEEMLYFKNKDALDLSQKIEFAIKNPDKMKTYTTNSQTKIRDHFSWQMISRQYEELYNR